MGSLLSLPNRKTRQIESCKKMRMSSSLAEDDPRLIPGLPDEISMLILARLPRILYWNISLVSRSWKAAVTGQEIFGLRKKLGTTEEWLYLLTRVGQEKLMWCALDPRSNRWQKLPPMPVVIGEEETSNGMSGLSLWNPVGSGIKIVDVIRVWLGQKDTLKRIPLWGCGIGAVNGCLYVLGGFSRALSVNSVWQYDPRVNKWEEVSSMTDERAFCKVSMLDGKLYVVGGVSRGRGGLTPLQSGEVYDPDTDLWTQIPSMPFSKAQALPSVPLAEMMKPIVTGMNSYKGRLCVSQSLYTWPFFVDVGGEIYDPETDSWEEMPPGMGEGWPARQAGAKLSVVVNGELYALDPCCSLSNGKIKVYDSEKDAWKAVIGRVPVYDFMDSDSPYLLAGFLGRLHVITKNAKKDIVVLQADVSTSSLSVDSSGENQDPLGKAEANVWKLIAARNLGAAELVSCQVLKI